MNGHIDFLLKRRSVSVRDMVGPGPGPEALRKILEAGVRVPDHGRLAPWRFIVIDGDAREALGRIALDLYHRRNADARGPQEAAERNRFLRAPVVVAVVARLQDHPKIPEWEQVLSSGACCINMLNAACALGFAAQWLTEWCAYDADFREALGLESRERIAGFIYMGTAPSAPVERQRPEVDSLVTYWSAGTAAP